jgi:hypothetical protein
MEEQKPVARFRAGSVSCAVWENQVTVGGEPQKILKAQVSRRYKDRNGVWKTTQSLSRNEIPLAIYVLGKAFGAKIGRAHV